MLLSFTSGVTYTFYSNCKIRWNNIFSLLLLLSIFFTFHVIFLLVSCDFSPASSFNMCELYFALDLFYWLYVNDCLLTSHRTTLMDDAWLHSLIKRLSDLTFALTFYYTVDEVFFCFLVLCHRINFSTSPFPFSVAGDNNCFLYSLLFLSVFCGRLCAPMVTMSRRQHQLRERRERRVPRETHENTQSSILDW